MILKANLSDLYKFNLQLGLRKLPKKQGCKRLIRGIEYFRCIEYPSLFNNLNLESGADLLDIGSANTIFPLFLCSRGINVWAVDIAEQVLTLKHDAGELPLTGKLTGSAGANRPTAPIAPSRTRWYDIRSLRRATNRSARQP